MMEEMIKRVDIHPKVVKSLIIENQAFVVILDILAKTALLVILASHFRARVDTPTKSPTWGLA